MAIAKSVLLWMQSISVHLLHFALNILLGLFDILPDITNFLLAVLGVMMSFPEKAEKLEKNPFWRRTIAGLCIVFGLAGFAASTYQRHQATSQMTSVQNGMQTTVANTNTLLTNTNTLVTNINRVVLMVPQLATLNANVTDLQNKIAAARGNPQLIATLQAQLAAAKTQANTVSRQILLTTLTGGVQQMRSVADKWGSEDRVLVNHIKEYGQDRAYFKDRNIPVDERIAELRKKQEDQNAEYSKQVMPLIVSVDFLRQQLIQGSDPSQEDRSVASTFAKVLAGETIQWIQMRFATDYMEKLANKLKSTSASASGVN